MSLGKISPKKLSKHFKRRWLKALSNRSYRKTTDTLVDCFPGVRTSYCCLGVAERICGNPISVLTESNDVAELNQKDLSKLSPKNLDTILAHQSNLVNLNDENRTWKPVIEYIKNNM